MTTDNAGSILEILQILFSVVIQQGKTNMFRKYKESGKYRPENVFT